MATPYGEMIDMISCMSISKGTARLKKKKRQYSYDEAMALR